MTHKAKKNTLVITAICAVLGAIFLIAGLLPAQTAFGVGIGVVTMVSIVVFAPTEEKDGSLTF